jgi:hypothetical protein
MKKKYSKKLRKGIILYFKKFHDYDVSDSEADDFLDSMADFYLWFNESVGDGCGREDADEPPVVILD